MISSTLLLFLGGFLLLTVGAESLVRGASRLAVAAGITPLVVGLTVVAYGTSAPELAVTVQSCLVGETDLALGNVVGSNICNLLLILGLAALLVPLVVSRQLIRTDVPLMIGISFLLWLMAIDGNIDGIEGALLVAGALLYTVWSIRKSRRQTALERERSKELIEPKGWRHILWQLVLCLIGLAGLTLGSRWLVEAAVVFAEALGVSELVIGLTIVSVGTSLPEGATSFVAALRGERDIAVGNAVGSNIFNILSVLGVSSMVAADGIPVNTEALYFDIPFMVVVSVASFPVFFTDKMISRFEGGLFFGYYMAYVLYLILESSIHEWHELYGTLLLWFALPLTLICLGALAARAWYRE